MPPQVGQPTDLSSPPNYAAPAPTFTLVFSPGWREVLLNSENSVERIILPDTGREAFFVGMEPQQLERVEETEVGIEFKYETKYEPDVKQDEEVDTYLKNVLLNFESDKLRIAIDDMNCVEVEKQQQFHSCNICNKIFLKKKVLYVHKLRVHCDPVPCTICGKYLKNKKKVSEHKKIVHDGIRQVCKNCGKGLTSIANLKHHERICGKMRRFKGTIPCQICSKTFSTEHNLLSHQSKNHDVVSNIDIFESPIKLEKKIAREIDCVICWKTFKKEQYLNKHLKVKHNTDIKENKEREQCMPFIHTCFICQQQFSTTKSIINHKEDIHTGQKPFQCLICKSRYETNSLLKGHSKRVHIKRKHSCTFCGNMFKLNNNLQNHIAKVHRTPSTS